MQPDPIASAARRIIDAYMKSHAIAVADAARLAVSVERALAEALRGEGAGASAPAVSGAVPRRAAALRGVAEETEPAPSPARPRRPRKAKVARAEPADDAQAAFDLAPEAELPEPEPGEDLAAAPAAFEEEEVVVVAKAPVAPPAAPQETPAETSAKTPAETSAETPAETSAKTGPEAEPEAAPAMEERDAVSGSEAPAQADDTQPRKRKRPPRPAHRRRAARVAAIEAMLVEGEVPPPFGEDEG
jgi:hypothetical protein